MDFKLFKNKYFFLTIIIDLILGATIFYLMNYTQVLMSEDAKINLTEIVTQNKNVITSKLLLEINNIELNAKQVSERFEISGGKDERLLKSIFIKYAKERNDPTLMFASADGIAVSYSGKEFDAAGRNYYRLGMKGISNISERIVSRLNGEDIFMICAPIWYMGRIIGTVQKQYTPDEMYKICSVSLFVDKGSSYIINSQGYILIFAQKDGYSRESDNYFRIMYLTDPQGSKNLEKDIKEKKSGFMETSIGGKEKFFAYTPIDSVYDWFLISSIDKDAVSPNSRIIIMMFYAILVASLLFFTFSMFFYIRQKRKQQSDLEKIAFFDPVTLGFTYTKFLVDAKKILQDNGEKSFCICVVDIDNFKYINSFYGFEAGDRILREINRLYSKQLNSKELVARVHSDHFVILLEDPSQKRIYNLISPEYRFGDILIYISTGLYYISNKNESINLMVDKATLAAQKIKGMPHRHFEVYSDVFDHELARNEQIKRSVETALAEDEIIPFFQPKVNLYTREIVGAEALARWYKKDGSVVSPGDFIPVCESSGLITIVDMAIYEKTLRFIKRNLEAGVRCVPISVNFSRLHLLNKNFFNELLVKLNQYKVPPELIELELTETVLFNGGANIVEFVSTLHSHGFKISMDDFGSGYSSLHMLKDVDIDILKIDRGFVLDTANSDRQKIIFGTIVDMANKLNIKVVVEGVDSDENLALVKEFGCNIIQGYYFSKPLDEKTFEKIYREGKL